MPMDPARRHQIELDAVTAAWEAERLGAWYDAIALLGEIADLKTDDDGNLIKAADKNSPNDLLSRIVAFLDEHDQKVEPT